MSESAYSNKAFEEIVLLIFTFIKYSLSLQELKVVLQAYNTLIWGWRDGSAITDPDSSSTGFGVASLHP